MEPRIVGESKEELVGRNNANFDESIQKVDKSMMYRDLSTVIICPTRGLFPTRVVQSWMKMMKPMNQLVAGPIFAESMEVAKAYNELMKYVFDNPYLTNYKYILTIEEDNIPPPDGLIKLYEGIEEYDAVGGLYWGKGEEGFPMIFGNPEKPGDMSPQKPLKDTLQRCNGLPMGFTLFKMEMLKDIEGTLFKTKQEVGEHGEEFNLTQDLYFFQKAAKKGYKFACDTRVLVGHYEHQTDEVW